MALARARRSDNGMNYWPGFVDALSTLILGIIFLLTVFVVVQFFLQQEVAGKDTALHRLNAQIAQLRASLAGAEGERDRLKGELAGAGLGASQAQTAVSDLTAKLEGEKRITSNALAQVEILNQQILALRRQLAALESALDVSEKKDKESPTR